MKAYDVIIAGGGTSGVIAAVSAAREGLKTLLIERLSALGGTQTFALVTPYMNACMPQKKFINSAIGEEIRQEEIRRGFGKTDFFDPEMLKVILEEKVLESGAEILYETVVTGVNCHGRTIQKISVFNSDGMGEFGAKMFIDCTGDAQLAKMSGVRVMSGNKDGFNQSASLRFEMANVDIPRLADFLREGGQKYLLKEPTVSFCNVNAGCAQAFLDKIQYARETGMLTDTEASHIQWFSVPGCPGKINFNCPETGSGKRISSAAERTKRYIQGRKSVLRVAEFFKKEIPGFENAYISQIAPMLGVRESERICAEYNYTVLDAVKNRRFPDAILKSAYPIDVHGGTKEIGQKVEYEPCAPEERYFEFPYRSLIPVELDNLLVCGRCAGCDFMTQSALRIQVTCQAMGEAAGIASAIAIRECIAAKEVDGVRVREQMRRRGSMI